MGFRFPDDPASPLQWAQLLDRASAEANEPLERTDADGWVLRFSPMAFNRFSSVWPCSARGSATPDERIANAEAFYADRGQEPKLVVSPASVPAPLRDTLIARGWQMKILVNVLTRRVPPSVAAGGVSHGGPADATPMGRHVDIRSDDSVTGEWMDAWGRSDPRVAAHPDEARRIVSGSSSSPPAVYLSALAPTGSVIGIARCVLCRSNAGVGVFGVWVQPERRRQGIAVALMHAAHALADSVAAPRTWLQVEATNAEAQRLYSSLGYRQCYSYECWSL